MQKILILLIALVFVHCTAQKKTRGDTWLQLFNGKDLKDWSVKIKDHPLNENFGNTFRVEDGVMKVAYNQYADFKEQYGHIFYKGKFSAYLLVVEYRFVGEQVKGGPGWALRNSGMMLHGQTPETMAMEQDFPISLEAQLLGGDGKTERTTGNLCTPGTNVILNEKLFTPHCVNSTSKTYHGDRWVKAEALVLRDSVIKHIVEGDTVLTFTKPQYDGRDKWVKNAGLKDGVTISQGTISLQSESHPVEFRKVALFNLEPYMSNPVRLQQVLYELKNRKEN
jgi:Domain of Unknown Function (DUF1080)